MADEFAIVEGTVPSSTGVQSITSGSITNCTAAILCWSGNYITEANDAVMGWAMYRPDDGGNDDSYYQAGWYEKGRSTTATARSSGVASNNGASGLLIRDNASILAQASVAFVATGIELNWSSVAGVSGSAGFKFWVLLIGGSSNVRLSSGLATTLGFTPDLVFSGTHAAGIGTSQQLSWRQAIGAAANGTSVTQGCFAWTWVNNADPVQTRHYVANAALGVEISTTGTVSTEAVSSFSGTGYSVTGSVANEFLAIEFSDARSAGVEASLFSGSGVQNIGSLSFTPKVVIGIVSGSDSLNTQANDPGGETIGVFVSDGTTTLCVSFSCDQGATVGTIPPDVLTVAFNRFKSGEVNLVDSAGGTAFRATSITMRNGGISWDVQTAMSGAIVLIAIGSDPVLKKSTSDTLAISETVAKMRGVASSDTLAMSETVHKALFPRVYPYSPVSASDTALAGPAQAGLGLGGAAEGDNAG